MADNLKRAEEDRRERCWNVEQRWLALQATLTWAEAQKTVQRNTPGNCLREQERKLTSSR